MLVADINSRSMIGSPSSVTMMSTVLSSKLWLLTYSITAEGDASSTTTSIVPPL